MLSSFFSQRFSLFPFVLSCPAKIIATRIWNQSLLHQKSRDGTKERSAIKIRVGDIAIKRTVELRLRVSFDYPYAASILFSLLWNPVFPPFCPLSGSYLHPSGPFVAFSFIARLPSVLNGRFRISRERFPLYTLSFLFL